MKKLTTGVNSFDQYYEIVEKSSSLHGVSNWWSGKNIISPRYVSETYKNNNTNGVGVFYNYEEEYD